VGFLDQLDKEDTPETQESPKTTRGFLDELDGNSDSQDDNAGSAQPTVQGQVQQNVEPAKGLLNVLKTIGEGIKNIPNAIGGFAQQEGQNLQDLGGNLANQPAQTIASMPGAVGYGAMQGVRDLAQGVTDIPFALANAYQGKEKYKNPIQLPDVGDIKDIYGVTLKDKYPGMGTAKTLGSFLPYMIPGAGAVEAGTKSATIPALLKSAGSGAGIGFAATPGNLQNKVSGAGAVGLTGAALHGFGMGIEKYNDLNLDTMTNKKLNKIYASKDELSNSLQATQDSIEANKSLPATHRSPERIKRLQKSADGFRNKLNELNAQENGLIKQYSERTGTPYSEIPEDTLQGNVVENAAPESSVTQELQDNSTLKDEYDQHIDNIKSKYGDLPNFKAKVLNDIDNGVNTPDVDNYKNVIALEGELNARNVPHEHLGLVDARKPETQQLGDEFTSVRNKLSAEKERLLKNQENLKPNSENWNKIQAEVNAIDAIDKLAVNAYADAHNSIIEEGLKELQAVKDAQATQEAKVQLQSDMLEAKKKELESGKKDLLKKAVNEGLTDQEQSTLINAQKDLNNINKVQEVENVKKEIDKQTAKAIIDKIGKNPESDTNEVAQVSNSESTEPQKAEAEVAEIGKPSEKVEQLEEEPEDERFAEIDKALDKEAEPKAAQIIKESKQAPDYYLSDSYNSIQRPQPLKETERQVLETESTIARKRKQKELENQIASIENAKDVMPAVKGYVRDWYNNVAVRKFDSSKNITELVNTSNDYAKNLEGIKANGKQLRELMPFLRERTEFPESGRPELKKLWADLSQEHKAKLTAIADKYKEPNEKLWKEYQQQNAGEYESVGDIENHISHIWDLDKTGKQKSLVSNYFITKSKFSKERTISNMKDGMDGIELANGEVLKLVPKTLDYAEILTAEADSTSKAIENKKLADLFLNLKNKDELPLVIRADKAPSTWVGIDHPALRKTVFIGGESKLGEKISPELQNRLYDLGITIGKRINSKAFGKPVGKIGEYTGGKEPPEIRLQRWFGDAHAHEIGHALDDVLGLGDDFFNRHENELYALNNDRIEHFMQSGDYKLADYAESAREQVAELFGHVFCEPEKATELAPNAMAEVLDRMSQNDNVKNLLPENFDWDKSKLTTEEVANTLFKMGVKVHPDIAGPMMLAFEDYKPLHPLTKAFWDLYDKINGTQKTFQLGFSGFHGFALSQKALPLLDKGILKVLNPKKIFNSVKNNDFDVYKQDDFARDAIRNGLKLEAPNDVYREQTENILKTVAEKGIGLDKFSKRNEIKATNELFKLAASGTSKLMEANNKVLWDVLHNNYKLGTYHTLVNNALENKHFEINKTGIHYEKRTFSDSEISDIKKEMTQFTNDVYGGQVWEILGVAKSMSKVLQRGFLSPDWLVATTREFCGMLSSEVGQKKLNSLADNSDFWDKVRDFTRFSGSSSITDSPIGAKIRGEAARKFWAKALTYSAIGYNAINVAMRLYDAKQNPDLYKDKKPIDYTTLGNAEGHKTYIFIGRTHDGKEIYLRPDKALREVPELITEPLKKLGGKVAPLPQAIITSFSGNSLSGYKNNNISNAKNDWEKIGASLEEMGKSFTPFALTANYQLYDTNHPITSRLESPAFYTGGFMPSSGGDSFTKGTNKYYDIIKNAKLKDDGTLPLVTQNKINKITEDLIMNKIDVQGVSRKSLQLTAPYQPAGEQSDFSKLTQKYANGEDIGDSKLADKVRKRYDESQSNIQEQTQNPDDVKEMIIEKITEKLQKGQ
jgi:hypothetical protein